MLEKIVEAQQIRFKHLNQYLAAGYRLLFIDSTTAPARLEKGPPYVRRLPIYIVGRTDETEHFDCDEQE